MEELESRESRVTPNPALNRPGRYAARAAQKYSLPILVDNRGFVETGGLFAYGVDLDDLDRQLAFIIDKILRGVKPADLPIQQPRKIELAINLMMAKTIVITIPPSLL